MGLQLEAVLLNSLACRLAIQLRLRPDGLFDDTGYGYLRTPIRNIQCGGGQMGP